MRLYSTRNTTIIAYNVAGLEQTIHLISSPSQVSNVARWIGEKSRISHWGCIDRMVGATTLYDVTLHWKVTSLKWLPYYSLVSFAEG